MDRRFKEFAPFEEVRDYCTKENISIGEYRNRFKTRDLPSNFPSNPIVIYNKLWSEINLNSSKKRITGGQRCVNWLGSFLQHMRFILQFCE